MRFLEACSRPLNLGCQSADHQLWTRKDESHPSLCESAPERSREALSCHNHWDQEVRRYFRALQWCLHCGECGPYRGRPQDLSLPVHLNEFIRTIIRTTDVRDDCTCRVAYDNRSVLIVWVQIRTHPLMNGRTKIVTKPEESNIYTKQILSASRVCLMTSLQLLKICQQDRERSRTTNALRNSTFCTW